MNVKLTTSEHVKLAKELQETNKRMMHVVNTVMNAYPKTSKVSISARKWFTQFNEMKSALDEEFFRVSTDEERYSLGNVYYHPKKEDQ